MKKQQTRFLESRAWAVVIGMAVSGCSLLLGAAYKPSPPPPGMSTIYLYAVEPGFAQSVLVDRTPETPDATHSVTMVDQGYYPYLAPPGTLRIITTDGEEPACIQVEVLPEFQYWVRVSGAGGEFRRLEMMAKSDAEAQMGSFRKISGENRGNATGTYDVECPENSADGYR